MAAWSFADADPLKNKSLTPERGETETCSTYGQNGVKARGRATSYYVHSIRTGPLAQVLPRLNLDGVSWVRSVKKVIGWRYFFMKY
jgi:hypothetical protein